MALIRCTNGDNFTSCEGYYANATDTLTTAKKGDLIAFFAYNTSTVLPTFNGAEPIDTHTTVYSYNSQQTENKGNGIYKVTSDSPSITSAAAGYYMVIHK